MNDIDKRDRYEERAASLEFDGEMRRGAAEKQAWVEIYGVNPCGAFHEKLPA